MKLREALEAAAIGLLIGLPAIVGTIINFLEG